ncbi:MAG: PQQ-binding-like beta-propeller repeat protein, partial [Planctomycetota bacterium]
MLRYVTLITLQFAIFATLGLTHLRSAEAVEDWPMWRGDASRSAAVANSLPSEFKLLWKRNLGQRKQAWDDPLNLDLMTYDRVFEPIVVDGVLCVGFNDQDKVVAYDAATGEKKWTFYTEAPVRLPACGADGKVYFCSDDGFLYCVQISDGSLQWKFRGAPNAQHALGNSRLTSAWPARGGPVLFDGNVYFAASIWPFMGTFLYSLNAKTGDVVWVNDGTGSQYIKQPHSAPSFAGVAPQGAMVATDDLLIVPGGRSVPAVFDRHTGELKYFEINAGGKGTGGSFVTADEFHYYVHTREKGTRAFNLKTGLKTAFTPNEPVLSDGLLYTAETIEGRSVIRAYRANDEQNTERTPIWEIGAGAADELILANNTLVAAAGKTVSIVNLPLKTVDDSTAILTASFEVEALADDESIARMLVANETLFVVGTNGTVAAYGNPSAVTSPQRFASEVAVAVD